jgi:hypothetical protein
MSSRAASLIAVAAFWIVGQSVLTQRAGSIDTISPAAARPGDAVTITGNGFGAFNVRVTVGGVPATVPAASGHSVTFRVPAGVPQGTTTVTATNPGGQSGSIAFQIIEGVLLPGAPGAVATSAETQLLPESANPEDIEDGGLILTRLDVRITPTATVGQINAALSRVLGGIVSMRPGGLELTVAIPRQSSIDGINRLIQLLNGAPGIAFAFPSQQGTPLELPPGAQSIGDQIFPTRFPAAWNARRLALHDCASRRVPILVADEFTSRFPAGYSGFPTEIPHFVLSERASVTGSHGYDVTTTMAALFNDSAPTGANPFSDCLEIRGVNLAGTGTYGQIDRLIASFPEGRFLVNFSWGFLYRCPVSFDVGLNAYTCDAAWVRANVTTAFQRAATGATFKARTMSRWRDFLAIAAAGNANDPTTPDGILATIYPGISNALPSSFMNSATDGDPFFSYASAPNLWDSRLADPNLPLLKATSPQVGLLHDQIVTDHIDAVGAPDSVMVAGSATPENTLSALHDSKFSNVGADVMAVGEHILTLDGGSTQGTSFSAPQVTGLASYLWLLSDELRNLPDAISATRRAIEENARLGTGMTAPVIDAYATILSLDTAAPPTPATAPVRLAILDVNDDEVFDETDIQTFLAHLLDASGSPVAPLAPDYSRYDLNGDGFTGGARVESFDLDRVGSTRFGAAVYFTDVTQMIEGATVHFNERSLNDLQILCYYAYSPMFTGSAAARSQLLAGCGGVTVSVTPVQTTVAALGTRQFAATVHGSPDPRVTWTAGGGTISATGLFTAGTTPGVFTVRATSVADSRAHADAQVTVTPAGPPVLSGSVEIHRSQDRSFDQLMSFSMSVRVGATESLTVTQITGSFVETLSFNLNGCAETETLDTQIVSGAFRKSGTDLFFGFTSTGTISDTGFAGFDENGHPICDGSSTTTFTTGFSDIPVTIVRAPDGHITALDFERNADTLAVSDGVHHDQDRFLHYHSTGRILED